MSIPRLVLTLVLAAPLLGVYLPGAAAQPQPDTPEQAWQITCVDCPKWFNELTDRGLRLDAAGNPHIAYGGDHLYYAAQDGASWRHETADPAPGVGVGASLVLNATGRPMISYFDSVNRRLKFAVRGPAAWRTETVDAGGTNGAWGSDTALDVDSRGRPHIAYLDASSQSVKYALRGAAGWRVEQVGALNTPVPASLSMAIDRLDNPHLCYFRRQINTDGTDLIYAQRSAAGWMVETVVAGVGYGSRDCSLALDANDQPAIAYPVGGQRSGVARPNGAGWQLQEVTWVGDSPTGLSLAFDAAGFPHISATVKMQFEPTMWGVEVQHQDETGWHGTSRFGASPSQTSLALNTANRLVIAHLADPTLTLSVYDGALWRSEGVDERRDVGRFSSLAVGAAGRPVIVYWPGKIAAWEGGAWAVDDTFQAYGYLTGLSLALGSDGQPRVAYSWAWSQEYLEEHGLDFVVRNTAGWQRTTLYSGGAWVDVGPPALALNAADVPQVASGIDDEVSPPGGPPYSPPYAIVHFQPTPAGWTRTVVDEAGVALYPRRVGLAVNRAGNAVVAYTAPADESLKVAFSGAVGWLIETVDAAGGYDVALALDAAGRPHVSYVTADRRLMHAHRSAAGWLVEQVAPGQFHSPSLAVESAGRAHISAYAPANQDLFYAYQTAAGWHTEVVAARGGVGQGSSLALTPAGRTLISFYDATTRDLMLAVQRIGPPAPRANFLPVILRR